MPAHKHIFQQVVTDHFVETGFYKGEGVQLALDVGFPNIHSIEIDKTSWQSGLIKYYNYSNVYLYHGDSQYILEKIIRPLNGQITFWLDGHMDHFVDENTKHTPILEELAIIAKNARKDHIIMIDDMRCCGTPLFDNITKAQIEQAVLRINSNYTIQYLDSWEPNDILCAYLRK